MEPTGRVGARTRPSPRPGPTTITASRGEGYPRAGHSSRARACAREEVVGVRDGADGCRSRPQLPRLGDPRRVGPIGSHGPAGVRRVIRLVARQQQLIVVEGRSSCVGTFAAPRRLLWSPAALCSWPLAARAWLPLLSPSCQRTASGRCSFVTARSRLPRSPTRRCSLSTFRPGQGPRSAALPVPQVQPVPQVRREFRAAPGYRASRSSRPKRRITAAPRRASKHPVEADGECSAAVAGPATPYTGAPRQVPSRCARATRTAESQQVVVTEMDGVRWRSKPAP